MRLPVIGNISTKDGATNKNARLTNMLAEQKKNGTTLATVRPGLNQFGTTTGNGNGLVCFNGSLISVFGANIGVPAGDVIQYDSTTHSGNVAIIGGAKLGGGYVLVEEEMIYTTTDFSSFTDCSDSEAILVGTPMVSDTKIVVPYVRDDDTYWTKVFDTSLSYINYQHTTVLPIGQANTYGNGYFVSNTTTKHCRSANGQTWVEGGGLPSSVTIYGKVWNGAVFALIYRKTSDGYLYVTTSTDGLSFSGETFILDTASYSPTMVTVADGWILVFGYNFIARSGNNGATWSVSTPFPHDFVANGNTSGVNGRGAIYNETSGKIMAVSDGSYYGDPHTLMVSSDLGISWVSDSGGDICYASVIASASDFICFKCGVEPSASRIQVLSNVGFGITNIASINDSPTDFALIP